MKKKILVLSGALAMVIAAGAIFFSAKTNSVDQAIFLDNIEALASGEPGSGSGSATIDVCDFEFTSQASSMDQYECKSGTTKNPSNSGGAKVYGCSKKMLKPKTGSDWGYCLR